jgi:hypothetical protein
MLFTLAVGKQPPVKKVDYYWPLALATLENASANSFKTATIELLCTSAASGQWGLKPNQASNLQP